MTNSPRPSPNSDAAERVVELVAFPSVQMLDVAGPLQVFATANDVLAELGEKAFYALRIVSQGRRQRCRVGRRGDRHRAAIRAGRADRHAAPGRRAGRASRGRRSGASRLYPQPGEGRAAGGLRLHRRAAPRRHRTARRQARGDALVGLRRARAASFPPSGSNPTRSSCATARSGPRPASPPASISRSRSSRRISGASALLPSRATSSSS